MNWAQYVSIAVGLISTLAGSGPWGIAAIVLGAGGIAAGLAFLISKWNKTVDAGDLERAGADSGNASVELKNQADRNRDFEQAEKDRLQKEGDPSQPKPPQK